MNTESKIAPLVAEMKTLKSYKLTPWLINVLFHILWEMHYKGCKNYKPVRKDIDFSDGDQVTIEHFVLESNKDTAPILYYNPRNGKRLKEIMY